MSEKQHYILFPNHDNGMRLHRELKALGIRAVIAPDSEKCKQVLRDFPDLSGRR